MKNHYKMPEWCGNFLTVRTYTWHCRLTASSPPAMIYEYYDCYLSTGARYRWFDQKVFILSRDNEKCVSQNIQVSAIFWLPKVISKAILACDHLHISSNSHVSVGVVMPVRTAYSTFFNHRMLPFSMLKYPLKCTKSKTAGTYRSGYFDKVSVESWFAFLNTSSVNKESRYYIKIYLHWL